MSIRRCHRVTHLRLLLHRRCWRLRVSLDVVLGVPRLGHLVRELILNRADRRDLRSRGAKMRKMGNRHRCLVHLWRSCHRCHRLEVRRHVGVILARRRGWPRT